MKYNLINIYYINFIINKSIKLPSTRCGFRTFDGMIPIDRILMAHKCTRIEIEPMKLKIQGM